MPTPTINAVRHLKNVGVLADVAVGKFPHTFKQYNLIYGFNGCGKTTLSRLLESLGVDGLSDNLSENAEFSFSLSDGVNPSAADLASAATRYIAVFNEDYVERTLTWKEGSARPIIYLGKEQAELAKRLEELEAEEAPAVQNEVLYSSEWSAAQRSLEAQCRNIARLIAEELNLGRRYNAGNLRSDFEGSSFTSEDKVSDEDRKRFKEIIYRTDLPPKVSHGSAIVGADDMRDAVARALQVQVSQIAIAALERRKDALAWVEEGVHLHAKHEQDCLFCGNILSGQRVADLEDALAGGFDKLSEQVDSTSSQVNEYSQSCRDRLTDFSSPIETLPTFRGDIEAARKLVVTVLSEGEELASIWLEQLAGKRARPDECPQVSGISGSWDQRLSEAVELYNTEIGKNNAAIDNFANEQEVAKENLKRHYLADHQSNYRSAVVSEIEAAESLESARGDLFGIRQEINEARAKLRTHGPAAEQLNRHLRSYLGHAHISLEAVDDGYRICRNGKESRKPLSEGEKTAVAFCYFLTSLGAEGRQIEDTIVILDDPISSLDARAMTHVVSTIRRTFKSPTQMFLLTHNLDFMREMKKWLNRKYESGSAEFLYIETGIAADGDRVSTIIKMPKLIREYESEYHYLYSLVKALSENPNGFEKFAYLMPNAIRKVLDIFLAFKDPGASGLEPKVDKVIQDYQNLDASRVKAMERLAHLESHSENIGDVTTFSAYTLAQVADAASCLLELIEIVDPKHKSAMDRLCRP